jgi:predicted PurR-regulated permease PerM
VRSINWGLARDQSIVTLSAIALLWVASQIIGRLLHVVVIVLLAVVLAYALEPALSLGGRLLPRGAAAILIYAVALGVIAGLVLFLGPPLIQQSESFATRLPAYVNQLNAYTAARGVDIHSSVRDFAQSALTSVVNVVEVLAGGLADAAVVLFLGFWFMVDGRRIRELANRLVPRDRRDQVRFIEDTVSQVVGAYIRGQILMATIIGTSAGVGSWILGVHYPVLIGMLAFLFELVPLVGPILGSVPAIAISLTQPFPLVLYVIAFFVVMQLIENNVLAPRITGGAVGLHPVVALLAIVAGADLGGIVGALFAVPLAGVVSVLVAAAWKGWHGQPVVVERAGMRFRLPRRRKLA